MSKSGIEFPATVAKHPAEYGQLCAQMSIIAPRVTSKTPQECYHPFRYELKALLQMDSKEADIKSK
jgi:hypothetical protein